MKTILSKVDFPEQELLFHKLNNIFTSKSHWIFNPVAFVIWRHTGGLNYGYHYNYCSRSID